MGLISKIEDKLSGNSHSKDEPSKLEKNAAQRQVEQRLPGQPGHGTSGISGMTSGQGGGVGSSLQHTIGSGSGPVGSAVGGAGGAATASGLASGGGHGSSMADRARGEGYASNQPSTTERAREAVTGSHGQSHQTGASRGFDPYSSSGQRAAATAGEKSDVARTSRGGVSNQMEPQGFSSGPHEELENRRAVPTAGGEKVGGVGTSSSYGTGAATGAAAGAATGIAGRDVADRGNYGGGADKFGSGTRDSGYGTRDSGYETRDSGLTSSSQHHSSREPGLTSSSHRHPTESSRTNDYAEQPRMSSQAAPMGAAGMHPGFSDPNVQRRPVPGTELSRETYEAPGQSSMGSTHGGISHGREAQSSGYGGISEGRDTQGSGYGGITQGRDAQTSGHGGISQGRDTQSSGYGGIGQGRDTQSSGYGGIGQGRDTQSSGHDSISRGSDTQGIGSGGMRQSSALSQGTDTSSSDASHGGPNLGSADPAYEAGFREAMAHREAGYKAAMEQMNHGKH